MIEKDRTHTCGDLKGQHIGQRVVLKGWVHRRRDHGGVIFIDLRDRYGMTQIVFRPEVAPEAHRTAEQIRSEFVVSIAGEVLHRPQGMVNPKLPTGEIEVLVNEVKILTQAKPLPFSIEEETDVAEATRLRYRYLDLRRPSLQKNLLTRHKLVQSLRGFLNARDFVDVETPFLTRSTPEGARDYLVPSRVHEGMFYALPQSPQLFKQILMISGIDRYYQIVRCFRDEDLRADRQPEFTQLDLEMSFAHPKMVQDTIEELMVTAFREVLGVEVSRPFRHMSYDDAMERFASDKPDLRWPIEMQNVSDIFKNTQFRVIASVLANGGEVRAFRLPQGASLSRSQLDKITDLSKEFGAKGLIWIRRKNGEVNSSVEKALAPEECRNLAERVGLEDGDLALCIADHVSVARSALNSIRLHCVNLLKIPPQTKFAFLWVDEFPLLEWNADDKRFYSKHHPFTSPHVDDVSKLDDASQHAGIRAQAYDLVLNGYEVGGGSIRIHDPELQRRMFSVLSLTQEEARQKFGFFLESLEFGTPPHGGIALGVDRLSMIMCETDAIRDVIAFPKTQSAMDLMSEAPSPVDERQLRELSLRITKNRP